MNYYLTPYIQEKVLTDPDLAESLKFELDKRIYYYGDHFLKSAETNNTSLSKQVALFFRDYYLAGKILSSNRTANIPTNSIVSNSYVSIKKNLNSIEHSFIRPPWDPSLKQDIFFNTKTFYLFKEMKEFLNSADFNALLSKHSQDKMKEVQQSLMQFFSNDKIAAGLFPNDVGFFENQSIKVLRKLKKPSFLLIHGIPAVYNLELYNKSDYLFVWGNGLKNIFIENGFASEKIKVVGHPASSKFPTHVRSSLDSILVLGSPMPGSQHYKYDVVLRDRGNIILYCYMIQRTLGSLGVKKVRLRPHPSENKNWYRKFIDNDFFEMDESNSIKEATKSSSLVIGPSSSSSMETLLEGINYIVFEPFCTANKNSQYKLVPPFDGSDKRLLVAKNENELYELIKNKKLCDPQILEDFLGTENCLDQVLSELL